MHMTSLFPPFGQMQTQQIRPSPPPPQPPPQLHQVNLTFLDENALDIWLKMVQLGACGIAFSFCSLFLLGCTVKSDLFVRFIMIKVRGIFDIWEKSRVFFFLLFGALHALLRESGGERKSKLLTTENVPCTCDLLHTCVELCNYHLIWVSKVGREWSFSAFVVIILVKK